MPKKALEPCWECGWDAGHDICCMSKGKQRQTNFQPCPCGIDYRDCEYHRIYACDDDTDTLPGFGGVPGMDWQ